MAQTAVVLFAHGARNPEWSAPLNALQDAIRARGMEARLAYLELQTPALADVIASLAPDYATVKVMPVFWSQAGHVRNELPAVLATARKRHPGVRLVQLPTLSQVPGVLALLADFITVHRQSDQQQTDHES